MNVTQLCPVCANYHFSDEACLIGVVPNVLGLLGSNTDMYKLGRSISREEIDVVAKAKQAAKKDKPK